MIPYITLLIILIVGMWFLPAFVVLWVLVSSIALNKIRNVPDKGSTIVLTQQGVLRSIGRARAAKGGEGASVDGLPAFLRANNLKPFISKNLEESTKPIIFKPNKGGRAFGYKTGNQRPIRPGGIQRPCVC